MGLPVAHCLGFRRRTDHAQSGHLHGRLHRDRLVCPDLHDGGPPALCRRAAIPKRLASPGINVTRYKLMAFVFCSGAAGVAGILFASRLRSINPAGLQGAELTVIAAAILGGTSLFGGAGSVIKTSRGCVAPLLAHQRLQHPEPWRQLAGPDRGHRGGVGSSDLHRRRQQDEIEDRRLIGKRSVIANSPSTIALQSAISIGKEHDTWHQHSNCRFHRKSSVRHWRGQRYWPRNCHCVSRGPARP